MHTLFLIVIVFLAAAVEVVEMVTIVVSVGATRGRRASMIGYGAGLLVLAVIVGVGVAGAVARRRVERVPGKALKFVVGLLLVSYGTFWCAEGLGVAWPLGDFAILVLIAYYGLVPWVALRRPQAPVGERSR